MAKKTIYKTCETCDGAKVVGESVRVPPNENGQGGSDQMVFKTCPMCQGDGRVVLGELDKNLVDEIKAIKDTVDLIWAKVNV